MELGEKGIVGISKNVTYWLPVWNGTISNNNNKSKELGPTKAQMW